jgi:hypothetical protein
MMNTRFNSTFSSLSAFCTLLIALTLSSTGCWKEPVQPSPPLPPKIKYDSLGLPTPTQIGIGSFGFLLGTRAMRPGCGKLLYPEGAALYVDIAQIKCSNQCNVNDWYLHIAKPYPVRADTFRLADPGGTGFDAYYTDYKPLDGSAAKTYYCSQSAYERSYFNVIHHDEDHRIMSGNFSIPMFKNKSNGSISSVPLAERDQYLDLNDSIIIKDGRFDVVHR